MEDRRMKEKLKPDNFLEQITQYGYFAETFPDCFSSKQFSEYVLELSALLTIKHCSEFSTAPEEISTFKNDISRRILSVPNPEAFLRLAKVMANNWDYIISISKSENSLSPITYNRSYSNNQVGEDIKIEELNSENLREKRQVKSSFIENVKESIRAALGFQYRLKVDVANCYNSIYTHSVTWAICGKKQAKGYMKQKPKPSDYMLGDDLDTYIRYQKNNETNGIVVGPFSSRIFSEIIMSAIDGELRKKGFVFKRYVDDFKFYFRTRAKAEESIQQIEKILNEYNLNLNLSKTEIMRFPYEKLSDMKMSYDLAFEKDGIFGVLNEASIFYENAEKGAFKYALKYIKNKELKPDEFDIVFPLLVNIMLLDPKYGNYVIQFMKTRKDELNVTRLTEIANSELQKSLEQGLQQESLLFLYMIRELELLLSVDNLKNTLSSQDDFSILIALDLWKNRIDLIPHTSYQTRKINEALIELGQELKSEDFKGSRWLLLYELQKGDLLDEKFYTPISDVPDFFTELTNRNISFFIRM